MCIRDSDVGEFDLLRTQFDLPGPELILLHLNQFHVANRAIARFVFHHLHIHGTCVVFIGPGHFFVLLLLAGSWEQYEKTYDVRHKA